MNKLDAPSQSKIITEIRELFDRYGPTFVDLADGERSDLNALLDFYSAPLRFIGSNFHMVMKDNEALTGEEGIGGSAGCDTRTLPGLRSTSATSQFSTLRQRWSMPCGCGATTQGRWFDSE